ncbi:MAG: SDR family NAD(P)-dependent oxidoreductase, partial [Casimicrobiaceae bacterium]
MATPRTALVTGAARGIGLATAACLLAAGHRVAIVDRDADALARAAATMPADSIVPIAIDITAMEAPEQIARMASSLGLV